MLNFKNKTVMVTGAAGNLGRSVARLFAYRGANRILVDLNAPALEQAYPVVNDSSLKCAVNLTQIKEVEEMFIAATERFGKIDILTAIAGGFHMGEPVHKLPKGKWDMMMDLNARTFLNTVAGIVPGMIEQGAGKIVSIGANAAKEGHANMSAYIVSKSAVMRLTESMSAELRVKGINVNCVMPSIIDTPENRTAMPDADPENWVSPKNLGNVILFLCSDEATAIHGASIPVVGLS